MTSQWYHRAGTLARDGWELVVDQATAGWHYAGLRIAQLDGQQLSLPSEDVERLVLPLNGSCRVATPGWSVDLAGRESVFAGATDMAYVGPGTDLTLTGRGRIAVASAPATTQRPPVHLPASGVPIEFRGTGNMSRQVRNFGTPDALDAQSIIACEVLTPAGNWSSYPPHKHDHAIPEVETELEEIYYFSFQPEAGGAPGAAEPFGYQQVSASDDRPIDVLTQVGEADVVLVPYGWHGPSMAAPGYDMYYLNVMAGPGPERAWRISDHPGLTWLRGTWPDHQVDPRLPFGDSTH